MAKEPGIDPVNSVWNETESDPWYGLRAFTGARIALGRTGTSVPLKESLAFKLAHAHARDAVYSSLDTEQLLQQLKEVQLPVVQVHSQVTSREAYLQRPDLGRRLNQESQERLKESATEQKDVVFILADGLSASAVNDHATQLLKLLIPQLQQEGFLLAPLVLAEQARVAIADEIGELLQAQLTVIFIGERPGLSSPNSLGAYFTYAPKLGLTDEARNCISNIRPEGLPYQAAAEKILYLIRESLRRKLTGVALKDEMGLLEE